MTTGNQDEPLFSAVLTPHRSLTRNGFIAVMLGIGASSLTAGLIFWFAGAWPVVGFMGLDVLAVYFAFRLSYRAARAFEHIEMSRNSLVIRKVDAKGNSRIYRFHPYWARLEIEHSYATGITEIRLTSHGRRVSLGSFLGPDDRDSFAAAFADALKNARSYPVQESGGSAA
jgi:uncharacterized membrane protein